MSKPAVKAGVEAGIIQPKGFPGLPPGWTTDWETFRASDDQLNLFAVHHHAEPWVGHRALIVLHGHGEHGGRYLHLPHYLQSAVDSVYCLDQRGHGRAEGLRGHIERFDLFADDAALAIRRLESQLKKKFGQAEIHLLGHSLGGHIAIRTLILNPDLPVASVTVTAPFLAVKQKVPAAKKAAAYLLSNVWGSLQLGTGLDPGNLSHDPEVRRAYEQDRLGHDKMTPKFYTDMIEAMRDTLSRHEGIRPPFQMIVPLADEIVDEDVAQKFYRGLKHAEKRLRTFADFYHEPMNEVSKEKVFAEIASWIQSHGDKHGSL